MQDVEQVIRAALDGSFMQWNPNKNEFSCKHVPANYMPDYSRCLDFDSQARSAGRNARKRQPDDECRAAAMSMLRGGMGASHTKTRLVAAFNISTASADIVVRAARREIFG